MKTSLVITAIALAVPMTALAQSNLDNTKPFGVRGGFSYLTDHDSRSATSNSGWTLGGSYDFLKRPQGDTFSIDVDYDQHHGNGNKIETWAFQAAVRAPFTLAESTDPNKVSFYYGAGLGLFRHHLSGGTTTTTGGGTGTGGGGTQAVAFASGSVSETKNVFGGSLILGAKFKDSASVELYYRISGSVEGTNCNTLGVVVGFHF